MKVSNFDGWLARDAAKTAIILIFGPDRGLVHERASLVAKKYGVHNEDPFGMVRLDGDELSSDPARLSDEANSISMFGGKRFIWVRVGSKPVLPALAPLLALPPLDSQILIEAGDMKGSAPLRTACEKSANAASIICYADESNSILALIDTALKEAQIGISKSARELLVTSLGGDRAATRSELEKLVLYSAGKQLIEEEDILAIVSDVASLDTSTVIDGAFNGTFDPVETEATRLFAEGLDAGVMLGAALRHAIALKRLIIHRATSGDALKQAATVQGIFFKRHHLLEQQLKLWTAEKLDRIILQISDGATQIRKSARLGQAIATRTLWMVTLASRRR